MTRKSLSVLSTACLAGTISFVACSGGGHDTTTLEESEPSAPDGTEAPVRVGAGNELAEALSTQSPALTERYLPTPEVALRLHGTRVLPKLKQDGPAMDLGVDLARDSRGAMRFHPIENAAEHLELTPLGVRQASAEILPDGRVLYANAYTNTDLIVTAQHNRAAMTLVLHDERSPGTFSWRADYSGLRQVQSNRNETALVNAAGNLRLTIREAIISDATGKSETVQVVLGRDGMARLHIDRAGLQFPVMAQFDVDAPRVGLAVLPPEIVKARMMVLVDTSGSMIWHFDDNGSAGGDSPQDLSTAALCDNGMGTGFDCNDNVACNLANGGVNLYPVDDNNDPSRMLSTKLAMLNVINAHSGLIDFGLMRYQEHDSNCDNQLYCCDSVTGTTNQGRCINGTSYLFEDYDQCSVDPNGCDDTCATNIDGFGNDACTCNSNGDCDGTNNGDNGNNDCVAGYCKYDPGGEPDLSYQGTSCSGTAGDGGRVLEFPLAGAATDVRQWFDFVEDTCSTGAAGERPRNPELRADGNTPLAYSIDTARLDWYQPAFDAWDGNNTGDPLYDNKFDCRPYVLVVLTDGNDTCASNTQTEPPAAVTNLRSVGGGGNPNPVTIYTLGMGDAGGLDQGVLDNMMSNGGSGRTTAPIAANQVEIEAAFADIIADTVLFEVCNGIDDNCNGRIDEGLGIYQECIVNNDCEAGSTCDMGRCTCSGGNDSLCASGFACAADDFCRPACNEGQGECRVDGVEKCGVPANGCCVDNGANTCDEILTALPGSAEVCNLQDDDCDGEIDEDFPDNCPVCVPLPEVCNGVDDDCDGDVDNDDNDLVGIGAPCGTDEGICQSGTIICTGSGPDCDGEVGRETEVCNGLDDDCNGSTDGQTQACYTGPNGTEDVGVCHGGTQQCIADGTGATPGVACSGGNCWGQCVGEVIPTPEVCDGLDNDCDSDTDEGVPADTQSCQGHGDCAGSNNCINNSCRCNSGSCNSGNVCGGDGFCHPPAPVSGDECCQPAFGDVCGVGVCTFGVWTCTGSQVSCVGGQGPSDEICDGLDNDCDGEIDEEDDLVGVNDPCEADGACGGVLKCQPENGGIICVPDDVGQPEVCDGIDNDCDNEIDEWPDILENDTENLIGEECNPPDDSASGPPCTAGTYTCIAGNIVCEGDVGPGTEICNGIDDDCDNEIDENTCPDGLRCIDGSCATPCQSGEFPCPAGLVCQEGFCIPRTPTNSSGSGTMGSGSGTTGSGGTGGGGTGGGSGGTGGGNGGTATGGSGADASTSTTNDTMGSGGTAGSANGGSSGSLGSGTGSGSDGDPSSSETWGLATGGGGCDCKFGGAHLPTEYAALLGLVAVGGIARRRRSHRSTRR